MGLCSASFKGSLTIFTVHRRIGGLENVSILDECFKIVHRRIGGLEIKNEHN
ncbi:protein of unknown function [Candidatus Nitrosacidococcus tergens]|uniref:Uncharacterized protein n=1 Tax=Candidatus Nitrosacidococcus tergens TaxID=553981 RepID=A0A7G1Q8T0_9GAMM|nr:protein of unknown function [Candidatus Nitrosacidococcus tergens]